MTVAEVEGWRVRNGGNANGNHNGSLNEISIWSTTLNQTQINKLYNDGKAFDVTDTYFNQTNLKGYWRNNGLGNWPNIANPGTHDATMNNSDETMLITAGVDGSRDSQGFLMNRKRTTNSLNLEDDMADGAGA